MKCGTADISRETHDPRLHSGPTGITDLTPEVESALFEAGCGDALLSMRGGAPFLTFSREAETLDEAIQSAIGDVRTANIGVDVLRVHPIDAATLRYLDDKGYAAQIDQSIRDLHIAPSEFDKAAAAPHHPRCYVVGDEDDLFEEGTLNGK